MIFDHGYEPQSKLWEKFISFAALTDVEGEEQEISTYKQLYKQHYKQIILFS